MRDCFDTIVRDGGGVIFIDEFDALFKKRGSGGGGRVRSGHGNDDERSVDATVTLCSSCWYRYTFY